MAVVVVLLLVAASIAIPSIRGSADKARSASVAANVNTVRIALEAYAAAHGGDYPDPGGPRGLVKALVATKGSLPGDRMPTAGWQGERQTEVIPAVQVATEEPPGHLAAAGLLPSRVGTVLGPTRSAGAGQSAGGAPGNGYPIGATPEDALFSGAFSYDRRGKRYVLYGTGRRSGLGFMGGGSVAIVAGAATDPATGAERDGRKSPSASPGASAVPKPAHE